MDCKKINFNIFSGISKAYINDDEFRKQHFQLDFRDKQDVFMRCHDLQHRNYDREKLVHALKQINQAYYAGEKTMKNIEKLMVDSTLCVVTGQQVGIFGGPLYTIYKVATTIKKAREFSKILNTEVVPIFWIASEDHDFEEIRSVSLFDEGRLKKFKMDKKAGSANKNPYKNKANYREIKEPSGFIDVNESLFNISENVVKAIENLPSRDLAKEVFINTLSQDDSIADWFGKIYAKLFKDEGLIIIDPMNTDIRKLGQDFLYVALNNSDKIMNLVRAESVDLKQKGFDPLIDVRKDISGLYIVEDGERKTLFRDENYYYVQNAHDKKYYTKDELVNRICHRPYDFSTNVVLRPIIQDVYLPSLAYVGGPGEIAYYAQLKNVYAVFDMTMPMIIPRENYVYRSIDDKLIMAEHHISMEDILSTDLYEMERMMLKKYETLDIDKIFCEFSANINRLYCDLLSHISLIDKEIDKISDINQHKIQEQINYLKNKSHRFYRKKYRNQIAFLKQLFTSFRPYDSLQERKISTVYLIAMGGKDIVKRLLDDEYSMYHRLIDF